MLVKDFINLIKEYPEFELKFPIPDKEEEDIWPSSTTYIPVGITDVGYSSDILIIDMQKD